ncbi:hypothetical protein TthTF21_01860 [Thermus thermophilus]
MRPPGWKIAAVLLVGILAISFGSILVRLALRASGDQSLAFSLVMSAGRLALAALLLAPGWTRPLGGRAGLPFALAAGGFLALHFAFWITSLSYTSVAASTALVTTNPVWVTLLGWWLFGERPSFLTLLGVGVALLGGGSHRPGGQRGRRGGQPPPRGLPRPPRGAGGLLLLPPRAGGPEAGAFHLGLRPRGLHRGGPPPASPALPLRWGVRGGYPLEVYAYLLLMALLPQLVGHTSFNWATRHIPPVLVTLAILFEPVGASLLAYLLFGELPGSQVLLGALILLVGVALAVVGGRR